MAANDNFDEFYVEKICALEPPRYKCTFYGNIHATAFVAVDQLANLHLHFTSVPRCTPMRYNGTPMEILHLLLQEKK